MNKIYRNATFAANLHSEMLQKGITQEQLAKMIGVSRECISKYKNGRVPRDKKLNAIANALGVKTSDLLSEEEHVLVSVSMLDALSQKALRYLKIKEMMTEEEK